MIFTKILLAAAIFQVSAAAVAQKLTLNGKDIALKQVFKEIRKQTGFNVLWKSNNLNTSEKLNVKFNNASLDEVMQKCLQGKTLGYSIEDKTILITTLEEPSLVQKVINVFNSSDIKGTVLDENGKPLSGATLTVKGTSRTVITDANGNYFLPNVGEKSIIVITYVGHKTIEIPVSRIKGPIRMEIAAINVDEVKVNTAYGIVRNKKELGYATATVSGAELNRANSGSILTGLIGKVSGLNITEQSSSMTPQMRILIRGIRSFGENSNNQPLFVLNGSPLSFGSDNNAAAQAADFINNLNPADVEDVTVLKGANGTAMYGPEGVNGVIIITTKKPKSGDMSINFRVNNGFQRADFSNYHPQREFGLGDDIDFFGRKSVYSFGPAYDGRMVAIGYPDENGKYQMVPYRDRDDIKKFFNIARATRYNLSLSQADQKSSYYLSLGYLDQTGLLPKDKRNQATALLTTSRNFGSWLNLQFNMNYSRENSDRSKQPENLMKTPTFIPLLSYKDYINDHWSQPSNYWNGISPYQAIDFDRTKSTTNALTANISATIQVTPWLTVTNRLGMNYQGMYSKEEVQPLTFADYARINPDKKYDSYARVEDKTQSLSAINNDLLLTALHRTSDFMFRMTAGNSIRQNYSKAVAANATLIIPVFDLAYQKDKSLVADETGILSRSYSFFGNFNVGYKDFAFVEFTARNEWDSKRAANARGKDFYFGSNASILMKQIVPFLKRQDWLSTFRLRASVASTANMNIPPETSERRLFLVAWYPYSYSSGDFLLGYGFKEGNPNPYIKPERVLSQEYGTEIGLLNNRIKLDVSYYFQINNGVILGVQLPWLSGHPTTDNAGKFQNTGWEFDAGLNPLISFSKDINITLQGRFAINNNKVLKLSDVYNGVFPVKDPNGTTVTYYAREGHSAYEYGMIDWFRDPQGRVIVDANTGMPSVDYTHPKFAGRLLPVYTGSLTLNFNWKRLTFSAQADYSAGNDHVFDPEGIRYGTDPLTLLNNRQPFVFPNSVIEDRPGHYVENKHVALSNVGVDFYSRMADITANTFASAAYWKIRELAIQYDLPVKTKRIRKLTCSIYARDLFSFYPKANIYGDPGQINGAGTEKTPIVDASSGGGGTPQDNARRNNVNGGASDSNSLPGTKLYGFTVGITF